MDIYDESEAVKAINEALKNAGHKVYDEDELLNVIDMIWDYYEENGLLDIDDDFEADDDEDIQTELVDYIGRMLRKDKLSTVKPEDIPLIVAAEISYEDSLIDFND